MSKMNNVKVELGLIKIPHRGNLSKVLSIICLFLWGKMIYSSSTDLQLNLSKQIDEQMKLVASSVQFGGKLSMIHLNVDQQVERLNDQLKQLGLISTRGDLSVLKEKMLPHQWRTYIQLKESGHFNDALLFLLHLDLTKMNEDHRLPMELLKKTIEDEKRVVSLINYSRLIQTFQSSETIRHLKFQDWSFLFFNLNRTDSFYYSYMQSMLTEGGSDRSLVTKLHMRPNESLGEADYYLVLNVLMHMDHTSLFYAQLKSDLLKRLARNRDDIKMEDTILQLGLNVKDVQIYWPNFLQRKKDNNSCPDMFRFFVHQGSEFLIRSDRRR